MWDIKKSLSYWVFFSDLPNSPAHAERPNLETSRFKQREINVGFYVSVSPEFNLARVEVESPSLSSRCGNELICVLSIANPHPPPPLSLCVPQTCRPPRPLNTTAYQTRPWTTGSCRWTRTRTGCTWAAKTTSSLWTSTTSPTARSRSVA